MRIIAERGRVDLAKVYIALMREETSFSNDKYLVEFVESLQPPIPRDQKWVIIVSSQFGCPIGCLMCDAAQEFLGNLTKDEILAQIDYLVYKYYPSGSVLVPKFKIQFARMGEPSLNPAVLEVLSILPGRYKAPGLMPCISTTAPEGTDDFFEELLSLKKSFYSNGAKKDFQLQFSINTTDQAKRNELIPMPKWDFSKIADYGKRFHRVGGRKITLNFAVVDGYPIEPKTLRQYFDPEHFMVKLTPVNPTGKVKENNLKSFVIADQPQSGQELINSFCQHGYDALLSIGEQEENQIGSNCGEFVSVIKAQA